MEKNRNSEWLNSKFNNDFERRETKQSLDEKFWYLRNLLWDTWWVAPEIVSALEEHHNKLRKIVELNKDNPESLAFIDSALSTATSPELVISWGFNMRDYIRGRVANSIAVKAANNDIFDPNEDLLDIV